MGEHHCPKGIMQRFFITNEQIRGNKINFDREFAHQATRVLRLRKGNSILCIDPEGQTHQVVLSYLGKNQAYGEITESFTENKDPELEITLIQAIPKGDRWPYILQKCTELGVKAIQPLLSERTVFKYNEDRDSKKLERWRRIVKEAAEQSQRQMIPQVFPPTDLISLANILQQFDLVVFAWEEEKEKNLKKLYEAHENSEKIALIVGPEGGFSQREAELLTEAGGKAVALGPRILRSETAAVVLTAITLYQYGQMEVQR
jgi:16S rRNA (uracil1498-N3)-methyltransferase